MTCQKHSFRRGRRGRRALRLLGVGLVLGRAAAAPAQGVCEDPVVVVAPAAPDLEGYDLLFQQAGVSFYGRTPAGDPPHLVRLAIRNGNRHAVEVGYSLLLEFDAANHPPSIGLDRHCARIPAGYFATAADSAPAAPAGLRVRNLTIANVPAAASPAPDAPPATREEPPAEPPPAPERAPGPVAPAEGAALPGDTARPVPSPSPAPAGAATGDTASAADAGPDAGAAAEAGRDGRPTTVRAWALEAAYAAFYVLSAIVLVAAGVGLLLPVAAATALLLAAGVGALRGRPGEGARAGPGGK